jgi:hypothetical protein
MAIRGAAKYIPAFAYGHRIYPEHIAGMIGLPHVGNIIYVDPTNGSDTANPGTSQDDAYATVVNAEDDTVAGQHDVVIIAPEGGTGRTAETSSLTWDKRFTHLIGSAAPVMVNPRAGMSFGSGASSPCMTISENGCIFKNLTIATFQDINVLVNMTGDRNYFEGVHFAGIGNATTGDDTAGRCLTLTGSEENLFVSCTFGLDTVARSAANALLEQTGTCPRNEYVNCNFNTFNDNAGALWVKMDTGNCYERFCNFKGCFFNNPTGASSTAMTIGFDLSTTGNGWVNLINCNYFGATDLANNYTALYTNSPVVDTANQGLMVIQAT